MLGVTDGVCVKNNNLISDTQNSKKVLDEAVCTVVCHLGFQNEEHELHNHDPRLLSQRLEETLSSGCLVY